MSNRITLNRLYDKLNGLGVAPSDGDDLHKSGNEFWVRTRDAEYADRLAGAIRRSRGRAAVVAPENPMSAIYVFAFIDDMFDDPNVRQPPLFQVDGWT